MHSKSVTTSIIASGPIRLASLLVVIRHAAAHGTPHFAGMGCNELGAAGPVFGSSACCRAYRTSTFFCECTVFLCRRGQSCPCHAEPVPHSELQRAGGCSLRVQSRKQSQVGMQIAKGRNRAARAEAEARTARTATWRRRATDQH